MALSILDLVIVLIVAFVPTLLYMLWIWRAEIHDREPFFAVEGVFIYGLTIALGIAFILEVLVISAIQGAFGDSLDVTTINLILALLVAPFIEEFTKLTGVFAANRRLTEPENGLVYGAASGLGFAMGENMLYYTSALTISGEVFILTVIARTLTSTLLHTSSTAISGFGVSRSRCMGAWFGKAASWFPFYLVAVAIHSGFNFLASLGTDIIPDASGLISLISLFLSLVLVWSTFRYIRRKIVDLDRANAEGSVIRCQ
jgi:RsiW-degrading membrane proteinase PrsW (M82 family)